LILWWLREFKQLYDLQQLEEVAYMFITLISRRQRPSPWSYEQKSKVLLPPFDDCTEVLLRSVSKMRLAGMEEVAQV
jgi:peptide/nickel transport system ATP-binding protein